MEGIDTTESVFTMKPKISPVSLEGVSTYALDDRPSKVSRSDFAATWTTGGTLGEFLDRLPNILAASDFRHVVEAISDAASHRRTIIFGMGAHVIKVGLNPVLIDLMQRGVISALAMNGAGIIHDVELAMAGKTSEDVDAALGDGAFGMARETGAFLSQAIRDAQDRGIGLGEAVGIAVLQANLPFAEDSLLASAADLGIPATVHVAMGTDILHMHPGFDPAAAGAASHRDFRLFSGAVATLQHGVYLNVGSAVILPEVFLKAITLIRNLGHRVDDFTTVNMDFIQHYRPITNVVCRPTAGGGKGYRLTGHHEIMLPLLAAAVLERLGVSGD